jgi:hypothetical protein
MKSKGIAIGSAVAVLLLILALAPTAAMAHQFKTTLHLYTWGTIHRSGSYDWTYEGFIDGPKKCWGHRNVRFYREVPNAPDSLLGSKRSNNNGDARLIQRQPDLSKIAGNYYAKVRPSKSQAHGKTIRCTGDRSKTVTITKPHFL